MSAARTPLPWKFYWKEDEVYESQVDRGIVSATK